MANGTTIGTAYVRIEPSAKGVGNKISDVLNDEAGGAGEKAGSKLASGIGSALKVGGAVIGAGIAAASGAVIKFGQEAIESYANYEQLIGGVEKLYGDAAGKVEEYANKAYATAGMSANAYMETATAFSASLISSLGNDVDKAAEMTDIAMQAMSDNANVFGSDMESVQNAVLGLAKNNYTMLDNLKLGFAGSKEGALQLVEAAAGMTAEQEKLGLSVDATSLSFDNMVAAIAVVQENMGIAGATSAEAMHTIEGSATATKAAWQNVITSIGSGEGLDSALDGLITSILGDDSGGGLLANILPRIETVMQGIGDFVAQAAPFISENLPPLISSIMPTLIDSAISLLLNVGQTLIQVIPEVLGMLLDGVVDNLPNIIDGLIAAIPILIEGLINLAIKLLEHLPEIIVILIESIPKIIMALVTAIIENGPKLIMAFIDALADLGGKLRDVLAKAWEAAKEAFSKVGGWFKDKFNDAKEKAAEAWSGVKEKFSQSWEQQKKIFSAVGGFFKDRFTEARENAVNVWGNIKSKFSSIWQNIKSGFNFGEALTWGRDMIANFIQGIKDKFNALKDAVGNIAQTIKNLIGFSEPKEGALSNFHTFAPDMVDLFIQGIEQNEDELQKELSEAFSIKMTATIDPAQARARESVNDELYTLLAQYLPLLARETNVNVSLEGDAQGLFREVRRQTNQFIKSTGASPFLSPA